MRISSIRIENFRGIKQLELELDETTVLIGENNSGKTAVLDALRLCLKDLRSRQHPVFEPLDFHLPDTDTEPASAGPIQIDVSFSEQESGEWKNQLVGRLNRDGILQVGDDGRSHVILRVTCKYDSTSRDFAQEWSFLNLDRAPLPNTGPRALARIQQEVPYFYLTALRNAAHHFDASGPFWRPFLKDTQLPVQKKTEIEQKLREVNELVVGSHANFEQVRKALRQVQDVVSLTSGDVVSIEAVPGRMFDILAKAQIHLGTMTGAKIPVGRHGEGTQSLAVLMLFSASLKLSLDREPIVALEEPEAHLHPSAVRALWHLIHDFSGQKLISTHSGDLLAETDIHQIRRLSRTPGGISAFQIPANLLSTEERRKFNYHIRLSRGELLFARCSLLVEGETEAWIYPAAARALDKDLHREGVRVVEYRQTDVGLLTKIANELGIEWYCVGDDDAERSKTEPKVKTNLGNASEADRLIFPYINIEIHLLSNGYEEIYAHYMTDQNLSKIKKQPSDPSYWTEYAKNLPGRAKTRAAADVAVEMGNRGREGVTEEIRNILDKVISLAGGA